MEKQRMSAFTIVLITILVIAVILMGVYIVYDKLVVKGDLEKVEIYSSNVDEKSIVNEETKDITNNVTNVENKIKVEDIYGVYSYSAQRSINGSLISYGAKITLYSNGTAAFSTGDGLSMIEYTKGTYTLKDNVITYVRQYEIGSSAEEGGEYLIEYDPTKYNFLSKEQKFNVIDENTLSMESKYFSMIDLKDEYITLYEIK